MSLSLKIILWDEKKEIFVNIEENKTVLDLINTICDLNFQLSEEYTALRYAGIKLVRSKTLKDQCIRDGSVILQEKNDLDEIPGLVVSYEPDMITLDSSLNEKRAKMPCGHVISRESMTDFLKNLITSRKYKIECPGLNEQNQPCKREWKFSLCARIGVLSKKEREEFEKGFGRLYMFQKIKIKNCPVCKTFILKPDDLKTDRVSCVLCSKQKQGYDFCWNCLKQWKTNGDKCGNDCHSVEKIIEILALCKLITIGQVKDVPEFRACPKCATIINHIKDCKHMKCISCLTEFCFICLKSQINGKWQCGSFKDICEVAPRQKEFPLKI